MCVRVAVLSSANVVMLERQAYERRRRTPPGPPSPYLEDLTKSLIISQPSRKKLQLVPSRRYPPYVSPYETLNGRADRAQLRAQLQTELAARHLLFEREAAAGAERCGVDLGTYATLLELQHREITPEDYDVLQLTLVRTGDNLRGILDTAIEPNASRVPSTPPLR